MRVAVIDNALCKPSKCMHECIRFCPINRSGSKCVWIDESVDKARISEQLCVGCGICIKKCPFKAISIVNLPEKLSKDIVHRYGPNGFELFKLPIPKVGKIVGIIGGNGVGKSTSLKILSGILRPNLGRYDNPPSWDEIILRFRGSELQPYFEKLSTGELRAVLKPQVIDKIPKAVKGTVSEILTRIDERGIIKDLKDMLALEKIWERNIKYLSGGELQRLAISAAIAREADIYLIDEPSSYLDVRERLRVAKAIRTLTREKKYVLLVEHDLAVLDYLSDMIHIIYGVPGVYGITSLPRGVRVGINAFLQGFLKEENIRIREYRVEFNIRPPGREVIHEKKLLEWSDLTKKLGDFRLSVKAGEIYMGEVIGILGPNGIGKTTFVRMLANTINPDEGYICSSRPIKMSYKPQFISKVSYPGSLREFLSEAGVDISSSFVQSELIKPLRLNPLMDRDISELSGGELQRAMIALALGKEADIYLLDEPMAYLDIEQRYAVARVIRRLTEEKRAATFVVEHDIVAIDFVASSIMVFLGEPGSKGLGYAPMSLRDGMNMFLKAVGVTFRRDPETLRPRINKEGSWLDRYQKEVLKEYYYTRALENKSK
ncbi:MAG: ribosome biogenesis/translation initiation ATPase RLI [Thermofilum sp. ex4484_79]|nr:MAG: ribosome biogenesis/translation initiation ATPase RLI [Thermofilum sp. ex4484_79]